MEVREEILKTDLQMDTQMKEIAGAYKDEVSLLSRISQYCYQCLGEFDFVEQELIDNPRMRFYGTLKFNGFTVGKGYGSNKKQVKQVAARLALMNLVPTLYRQWKHQLEPEGSPSVSEKIESSVSASLESSKEKSAGEKDSFKSPGLMATPE